MYNTYIYIYGYIYTYTYIYIYIYREGEREREREGDVDIYPTLEHKIPTKSHPYIFRISRAGSTYTFNMFDLDLAIRRKG